MVLWNKKKEIKIKTKGETESQMTLAALGSLTQSPKKGRFQCFEAGERRRSHGFLHLTTYLIGYRFNICLHCSL